MYPLVPAEIAKERKAKLALQWRADDSGKLININAIPNDIHFVWRKPGLNIGVSQILAGRNKGIHGAHRQLHKILAHPHRYSAATPIINERHALVTARIIDTGNTDLFHDGVLETKRPMVVE